MFCSLILRIRQISICNNFEKFPSIRIEKAREERITCYYPLLTVKVTSIAIGNSHKSDGLFLACRHKNLRLSIPVPALLGFSHTQPKNFRVLRRWARVKKEPWDHLVMLCFYLLHFHTQCVSLSNQCAPNNLWGWILFCHSFLIYFLPMNALQPTPILPC